MTQATSKKSKKNKGAGKASLPPICKIQVVPAFDTSRLFDQTSREPVLSALDQFLEATAELNKLVPPPPAVHAPRLGHLVLLGYMSAVESFFRTLFRRIIVIDEIAQRKVFVRDISYAAAVHQLDPKLLPEALFEGVSFAGRRNIVGALLDFLDITNIPKDVLSALDEFSKVCQLRHCLVHRFGKLGSKNAIELGLVAHGGFLEKPVLVPYAELQIAFGVLYQTVRVLNDFIFRTVLLRIKTWTWSLSRDRVRFGRYYSIFATKMDVVPSLGADDFYRAFRLYLRQN